MFLVLLIVYFFPQGNLKEEIKQLQVAEQQVKNRLTELTQQKETSRVRNCAVLTESWVFGLIAYDVLKLCYV